VSKQEELDERCTADMFVQLDWDEAKD